MKTYPCVCGNRVFPTNEGWVHAGLFHGPCGDPIPTELTDMWAAAAKAVEAARERGKYS